MLSDCPLPEQLINSSLLKFQSNGLEQYAYEGAVILWSIRVLRTSIDYGECDSSSQTAEFAILLGPFCVNFRHEIAIEAIFINEKMKQV